VDLLFVLVPYGHFPGKNEWTPNTLTLITSIAYFPLFAACVGVGLYGILWLLRDCVKKQARLNKQMVGLGVLVLVVEFLTLYIHVPNASTRPKLILFCIYCGPNLLLILYALSFLKKTRLITVSESTLPEHNDKSLSAKS
jgi:hypothetical protein